MGFQIDAGDPEVTEDHGGRDFQEADPRFRSSEDVFLTSLR